MEHRLEALLSTTCRLCATTDKCIVMYPILGCINKISIPRMIKKCINVEITADEECTNICESCLAKLDWVFQLQEDLKAGVYEFEKRFGSFALKHGGKEEIIGDPRLKCEAAAFKEDEIDDSNNQEDVANIILEDVAGMEVVVTETYQETPEHEDKDPEESTFAAELSQEILEDEIIATDDENIPEVTETLEADNVPEDALEDEPENVDLIQELFPCGVCDEFLLSAEDLENHQKLHNKKVRSSVTVVCAVCGRTMFSDKSLEKHLEMHTLGTGNACKYCNKLFASSLQLKNHISIHTGDKPFKCDVCDKSFRRAQSCIEHKMIHTGEKPFQCNECGKCFNKKINLKFHEKIHTGEKPYKCDYCEKRFIHANDMRRHKRTHTGERPYKCDSCNKTFAYSATLLLHKRLHTGEKPHVCLLCDSSFTRVDDLKRHTKQNHSEKTHPCPVCSKLFADQKDLETHKKVHTEEGRMICDVCGKSFIEKSNFKRHRKTHEEIFDKNLYYFNPKLTAALNLPVSFECEICQRKFKDPSSMKRHKMVHTGEKPFSCNICDKRFTRAEHVEKHKNTHMKKNAPVIKKKTKPVKPDTETRKAIESLKKEK